MTTTAHERALDKSWKVFKECLDESVKQADGRIFNDDHWEAYKRGQDAYLQALVDDAETAEEIARRIQEADFHPDDWGTPRLEELWRQDEKKLRRRADGAIATLKRMGGV